MRVQARSAIWVELSPEGGGVEGWLADDRGARLSKRRLLVQVADGPARWATTTLEGAFFVPTEIPSGGATVRATFPGGPFHAASSIERALDPGRRRVRLELIAPTEASLGDETLEVQAFAEVGNAPASLRLSLEVEGSGEVHGSLSTDSSGWSHATLATKTLGEPGHRGLLARFAGTEDLAPALARAAVFLIEPTTLSLESSDDRVRLGDRLRLQGALRGPRGPVAREEITLTVNGRLLATVPTDEEGRFTWRLDAEDLGATGTAHIVASFESPMRARSSSESDPVRVNVARPEPLSPWAVAIPAALTAILIVGILLGARRRRRSTPRESRLPSARPVVSGVTREGRRRRSIARDCFEIAGQAWDSVEDRPVSHVVVVVSGAGGRRLSEGDRFGVFQAGPLEAGTFTVKVSAKGYVPESFTLTCPHDGSALRLRVHLVQIRHRALEAYRTAASPLLPARSLWGFWTPREVAVHAVKARPSLADDLVELTSSFERAYYSGVAATMEDLEQVRTLSSSVSEELDVVMRGSGDSRASREQRRTGQGRHG